MTIASFRFPTAIRFGEGSLAQVPHALIEAKVRRPLVVTDRGLADLPLCRSFVAMLEQHELRPCLFAEASGNPVEAHVTAGVEAYRQGRADGVVMLGGGCALDVGKAIALMVHHPGELFDYEDDKVGARPVDCELPFMLAIPTTAGTGSEVGGSSVISRNDSHAKVIVWSPRLIPKLVIADPSLTVGLPPAMTAATGIDALTHNIEAYLAKNFHPICDGIALEGIRLVFENLETAYKKPDDLPARGNMLMASMMGAIAFQKGLGVTHSCAHALSTCFDLHHGLANAMMMIPCLKFNCEVVPERFVRMGRALGFEGNNQTIVSQFFTLLEALKTAVNIPKNLSQLGVKISDRLLDVAVADACHGNNPRPCQRDDFKRLFAEAMV